MYNYNYSEDYLMHYGVKGMKWGVRRAARANAQKAYKETLSSTSRIGNSHFTRVRKAKKAGQQAYKETVKAEKAAAKEAKNTPEAKAARKAKMVKAAKIGAVAAGTALAAYGAYKANQYLNTAISKQHQKTGREYVAMSRRYREMASEYMNLADRAKFVSHKPLRDAATKMHLNNANRTSAAAESAMNKGFDHLKKAQQGRYSVSEKAKYVRDQFRR